MLITGEPLEPGDRWMSIAEVAAALHVSIPQVRNLEGILRPERMPLAGNRRLYRASLVDAEIARREKRAAASLERRADIARREQDVAGRAVEREVRRVERAAREAQAAARRQAREARRAADAQRKLDALHEAYALDVAAMPGLTWVTWWHQNVAPTLPEDRRGEVPEGPK